MQLLPVLSATQQQTEPTMPSQLQFLEQLKLPFMAHDMQLSSYTGQQTAKHCQFIR